MRGRGARVQGLTDERRRRFARGAAAALAAALLAGCSAPEAFGLYDLPESPDVADAPWPKLAEGPRPAEIRARAPDPAVGAATAAELRAEAAAASARSDALSGPVVEVGSLRGRDLAARAEALSGPVVDVEALRAEAAALRRGRPAPE